MKQLQGKPQLQSDNCQNCHKSIENVSSEIEKSNVKKCVKCKYFLS